MIKDDNVYVVVNYSNALSFKIRLISVKIKDVKIVRVKRVWGEGGEKVWDWPQNNLPLPLLEAKL